MRIHFCTAAALLFPFATLARSSPANAIAPCHGAKLQAAQAPSLVADTYAHGIDGTSFARSIGDGFPEKGMRRWREALSADDIDELVKFIGGGFSHRVLQRPTVSPMARRFADWHSCAKGLIRVVLAKGSAALQEVIVRDMGRIRALAAGSDGAIYLALELRSEGLLVRLVRAPARRKVA